MNALVFPGASLSRLRSELLSSAPKEAAAVLIAGQSTTSRGTRLLIREHHFVPSHEYQVQEQYRVVLPPSFLMPQLKRARNEGWSLVLTHTHPFGNEAQFSGVDDAGEAETLPVVFARTGGQSHGSLVLGREAAAGRIFSVINSALKRCDVSVIEVGEEVRIQFADPVATSQPPSRFDRSVRAFGALGQSILAKVTVGIVGLGGIGSIVAEQLAHLGISRFILLDPDVLEESNLNRVVGSTQEDVGGTKAHLAERMICRIRPDATVQAIVGDVMCTDDARSLLDVDFLFGCTDSHGSRTVLNQIVYQYMIPAIDLGVHIQAEEGKIKRIAGRIQMLAPGLACLVCSNLLDSEQVRRDFLTSEARNRDPYIPGIAEPQPAVVSLNGTVASLGVTMMLSALVGVPLAARHQIVRFERGVVRAVAQSQNPDCIVCSLRGALGRGDAWPLPSKQC